MIENHKKYFLHQIGEQQYYIEIYLYNQLQDSEPFPVQYFFIDTLCIEENLMDWPVKGYIILNNDFETFEKKSKFNNNKPPFIFRTDGRNKISINIIPIINTDSKINLFDGTFRDSDEEFKRKWQMSFDCVIYDIEDIDTKNNQSKKRKLYFWDERYQILSEKNIEWSTAKEGMEYSIKTLGLGYINDPNSTQLPADTLRMIRANVAIRSLLYTAGKNPDESDIKVGFHEDGDIKYPTKRLSDCGLPNENWVMGDNTNRLFYTSPANSTVIDDINYMLPYSGTKEDGPVFLRMGRYQKEKEFRLISLRDFFYKSKEDQVEKLYLADVDSFENKTPRMPRSWDGEGNQIYNFVSGRGNKIVSYQYSPMVASDDKKIVNSPVHTYDFRTGRFHIVFGDNTAEGVINKMENLAEAGLYNFVQHKDKAQILLNLNQTKKQSVAINNVFLPNYFETDDQFNPENFFSFYARNEMMKDALFLNEALSFNVMGLTIRAPGRFIYIDSLDSTDYDQFHDRFLGQWMIIKVVHVFKQNSYNSNVVATKVDAHSKIWEKEDTKF